MVNSRNIGAVLTILQTVSVAGCGNFLSARMETEVTGSSAVDSQTEPSIDFEPDVISVTIGTEITCVPPKIAGRMPMSLSISPTLPIGLTLDGLQGCIVGKPQVVSPETTYEVKATNDSGASTASLVILVLPLAPRDLVYNEFHHYTLDTEVPCVAPTIVADGAVSFSIEPSLPLGLSLNAGSGCIEGTPREVIPEQTYHATARNAGGTVSAAFKVDVANPIEIGPNLDETPPVISDGTLTVTSITAHSLSLSWNAAVDTTSPTMALRYVVYHHATADLSSLTQIDFANDATVNTVSPAGTLTANIYSLQPQTQYFFNVVAIDEAGNRVSYVMTSIQTGEFCGGDGSSGAPFQVCSLATLQRVGAHLNGHFQLTSDIDASLTSAWNNGAGWTPVGTIAEPFAGTIDGQGHQISGLVINRPTTNDQGLFGVTASTSVLKNIQLTNVDVQGLDNTGALAGYSYGVIRDVNISGTIRGGSAIGGVVGLLWGADAAVLDSRSSGISVFGSGYGTGGLVGRQRSGALVTRSWSSGSVTGHPTTGYRTGGLVGEFKTGTISYSYSSATVSGNDRTGGLVGYLYQVNPGELCVIEHSHATGNVTGYAMNTGGLIGAGGDCTRIKTSYASGNVVSTATGATNAVGGLAGFVRWGGTVEDSYATGTVSSAGQRTGGLIGYADASVIITRCYATGNVTTQDLDTGGFVGRLVTSKIYDSFATGVVSSTNTSRLGGFVGSSVYSQSWVRNAAWLKPSGSPLSCIAYTESIPANADCLDVNDLNDFSVTTNAPLSSWDFSNIWVLPGGGALPILRE